MPHMIPPFPTRRSSDLSTQEAVEIQEFFAELLVAGGTWGVLEATSHALALRKLRGTEVDIAVFTNLSPEHLDFHGRSEEHTSELQSLAYLVCRLLLENK